MGEGLGVRALVSKSIYVQATAIYIAESAPDIEEIGIYAREIAADSREIGIYVEETGINWSEIATYIREIAADIKGMAVNIEEIASYARRNAAAAVRPLPAARFRPIQAETTPRSKN